MVTSHGKKCDTPAEAFALYDMPHGVLAQFAPDLLMNGTGQSVLEAFLNNSQLPTTIAQPNFARTISYSYDGMYRVTGANYCAAYMAACAETGIFRTYHYTYDLAGNITRAQASASSGPVADLNYTYNEA